MGCCFVKEDPYEIVADSPVVTQFLCDEDLEQAMKTLREIKHPYKIIVLSDPY